MPGHGVLKGIKRPIVCFHSYQLFLTNTAEGAQGATAIRDVERDCGSGSQSCAGGRGWFWYTHRVVAEAYPAASGGRERGAPDCLDGCHDGCIRVIFPNFQGRW